MSRFNIRSELDTFVIAILSRSGWPRWPAKAEAYKRCHYYERIGRFSSWYFCEKCGKRGLHKKETHCHHVIPRIPSSGYDNLLAWIHRTFCSADQLSILCHDCHHEVHKGDAKVRADNRKKPKTKKVKKNAKLS